MSKKVIYVGMKESFYPCTNPKGVLEFGEEYEVEKEVHENEQILYVLKGIAGEFNAIYFQKVKPVKVGIVSEEPIIGNRLNVEISGEGHVRTSAVKNIKYCYAKTWVVETEKTVYLLTFERK